MICHRCGCCHFGGRCGLVVAVAVDLERRLVLLVLAVGVRGCMCLLWRLGGGDGCVWWTHDDSALRACLVACSLPVRRESDRVDFALPFTHDDGFFYLVVDFGWPAVIDDDDDGVVRDDAWALCDGRMCRV